MSTSIDLSPYLADLHIEDKERSKKIKCFVRKRWFVLTPEETVRQVCIRYLTALGYQLNHINVEKLVVINGLRKRFDIVVYDKSINPLILIECKAPSVSLQQRDMDQLSIYHTSLGTKYLWLTNGHDHYIYQDSTGQSLKRIDELPPA